MHPEEHLTHPLYFSASGLQLYMPLDKSFYKVPPMLLYHYFSLAQQVFFSHLLLPPFVHNSGRTSLYFLMASHTFYKISPFLSFLLFSYLVQYIIQCIPLIVNLNYIKLYSGCMFSILCFCF